MATSDDVHMGDAATSKPINANDYTDLLQTPHTDAFAFSETEQFALQLYDQLRELELEKSLLEAHVKDVSDVSALSDDVLHEHLMAAEREAMEAKAKFEIRNKVSQNVLIMDPVLKAVHGGQHHTVEKRLLPLISENDAVSMVHGLLTTKLANTQRILSAAERGNIATNKENRNQSRTVLELAEEAKAQSIEDIGNLSLREQVGKAEANVKESRKRTAIIKGILSAMIVGSGINWAADEELRELVMDDEEAG
ncbi:hypothetical protein DPSP01_002998 [Paraphaeosphaeria sporulosa]|uniref:Centromere protein H C-terminal domain-containing protein n=1 Tax=Paraphaeosphaeria sporulosa TaxID=1460663 RepID=A0A177CKS8_9PLEO|nr:uncharacterized protein CC84DRAFT_1162140 [Paraphaeosphaeria sporulosa]OAG08144.1 hypothetical protein CC84DRAFT_1162140 [Paraphaeosphaeria sporulosa]